MQKQEKKKPPVTAANLSQKPQRKQPPRKHNVTEASERSDIRRPAPRKKAPTRSNQLPPDAVRPNTPQHQKTDQSMTKKAPPRKPPVKKAPPRKALAVCNTLAGLTSDVLAQDIKDIAYSMSSADAPTAPILDNENGNWDDFVDTFTAPRDPFDKSRDYSYTTRDGERRASAVPVTEKNYYGYIVPRCKGNRNNKALTKQQHIALDYDRLPIGTLHTVMMALTDAGAAHVVYTTASHLTKKKDGLECFRVVVPMDTPATSIRNMVAVRVALADVLARQIPGLEVDRASFTPSQPMFLPVAGSQVWHSAGRSQSVGKLLAHFDAAGLSVHVPRAKEGGARVPEGIDQIFAPVMDLLVEWGATSRDDSGRMLIQANEEHAEQYSTDSKADDFAFMFPMDGIAEVFNVSAIHGSDLDEMDSLRRKIPKKKGESVAAVTERRRLAGIWYAVDAVAPDEDSRAIMRVLLRKTIEAHKNTLIQTADEGDLAFGDEDAAPAKTKKEREAKAIINAISDVAQVAESIQADAAHVDLRISEMKDEEDAKGMTVAMEWLGAPGLCGCIIAFDEFKGAPVYQIVDYMQTPLKKLASKQTPGSGGWYQFTDAAVLELRVAFMYEYPEDTISRSDFRDCCHLAAQRNPIDTAKTWADSLEWDGVPRVESFFVDYFGCEDSRYSRAAALSLWSGAGGRLTIPGTKQDQTVILVGAQGAGKSTAIGAMVPDLDWFGEMSFGTDKADRVRFMRGKLLMEIAEMDGFKGKQKNEIKAFMTTTHDEIRGLYQEHTNRTARRVVFIGTSNETEILHDSTGERRWLPLNVGEHIDRDGIAEVCDQLWAEGIALFRKHGVMWQEANDLARGEHDKFKQSDTWEARILQSIERRTSAEDDGGLEGGGDRWLVTVDNIASDVLDIPIERQTTATQMRIAAILTRNGYKKKRMSVKGERPMVWIPPSK